jgi:hypothetical protein
VTAILLQQKTYVPTAEQSKFMREILKWDGAATPRELGPQTSQEENSARQTCKRRNWVEYDGYYWRITQAGRAALLSERRS